MAQYNLHSGKYGPLVGAVDQGTSSSRFLIFSSKTAEIVAYHQIEINQYFPEAGWVEEDPTEILNSVYDCIDSTVSKLKTLEIDPSDIKAIGITNQRETTIVWDKHTGKPLYNAIVWLDTRTVDTVESLLKNRLSNYIKEKCGLPISTYFSAVKLKWLIENVPEVSDAIREDRCLFGTVDSWLIWNLTGGVEGGVHMTDVSNASRTMLMNIRTLKWDPWLCNFFDIPISILPKIYSSSEIYGTMHSCSLNDVPISSCLGDQSAALVGQLCFKMGQTKNTYGTGCFLLCNTGVAPIFSDNGLLTTVGYKLGSDEPVHYALEGSVAIAGAAVRWLRDNLMTIKEFSDVDSQSSSVSSSHGIYFVPAFSGLYTPYWDPDARGIICGLTQYTTKSHLARATLEAVCFQTKEILDAINKEIGMPLQTLQVDGGMTESSHLMQLQADLLLIPVVRPSMPETSALGAAMAAGVAKGIDVWSFQPEDLSVITTDTFYPSANEAEIEVHYAMWKKAVQRSTNWNTSVMPETNRKQSALRFIPVSMFLMSTAAMLIIAQKLVNVNIT